MATFSLLFWSFFDYVCIIFSRICQPVGCTEYNRNFAIEYENECYWDNGSTGKENWRQIDTEKETKMTLKSDKKEVQSLKMTPKMSISFTF